MSRRLELLPRALSLNSMLLALPNLPRSAPPIMSTPTKSSPLRAEVANESGSLSLDDSGRMHSASHENITMTATVAGIATPPPTEPRGVFLNDNSTTKPVNALVPNQNDDVFTAQPTSSRASSPLQIRGPPTSTIPPAPTYGREAIARIQANQSDLAHRRQAGYSTYVPRRDRASDEEEISSRNAQGVFSPYAAIFVANLSKHLPFEQLLHSCQEVFEVYGTCHIKIKNDRNGHPFAIVQFEEVEAAQKAIERAGNTIINGRAVRIEQGKASRSVVITKMSGLPVSREEADYVLGEFGPFEEIYDTSRIPGRSPELPPGQFIQFAYYQDCLDALNGFQERGQGFRLQLHVDPHKRYAPYTTRNSARDHKERFVTDLHSIYVGGLSHGMTEDQLLSLFGDCGEVLSARVVCKVRSGLPLNTYGFVEFADPQHAKNALSAKKFLNNRQLRLELKHEYQRTSRNRRYNAAPVTFFNEHMHQGQNLQYVQPMIFYSNNPELGQNQHNPQDFVFVPPFQFPMYSTNQYPSSNQASPAINHNNAIHSTPGPRVEDAMLPSGLFTPTPHHSRYAGQFTPSGFTPNAYFSPQYSMHGAHHHIHHNSMGTIHEAGEDLRTRPNY